MVSLHKSPLRHDYSRPIKDACLPKNLCPQLIIIIFTERMLAGAIIFMLNRRAMFSKHSSIWITQQLSNHCFCCYTGAYLFIKRCAQILMHSYKTVTLVHAYV